MKTDDYRLLLAVEEAETIKGAAKALLISQPAVSLRLKQIEEQWGESIFIRTPKKVMPTPAGERILALCRNIVNQETAVRNEVSSMKGTVSGTLSLAVSSVIGQYVLPPVLENYMTEFPQVKVDLVSGLSEQLRSSQSGAHVYLLRGEKPRNGEKLMEDRLYLIDRKGLTKQNRPLIEFQSDPAFHTSVHDWLMEASPVTPSRKIKVDQIETSKQLLLHGIGMAVLPETAINGIDRTEYDFIPLQMNGKNLTRTTWLAASEAARSLPQVDAFLKCLYEKLHH
ncbi:LysR family transcriptional regulator [Alteribacter lacisalsi]|jgi:DNA-binding transcriptional LysR family regulator|uniref:LysR family transcriptional regulator n=1 Tax=Alteribacter lacisalsi TaxID=2045244 RepID=A0A2W0H185_9BACI|nr:LysR family transcriptional regulator [Alteribacter lacisalsi]PYZ95554.1 LysR family transcriptional regulator [Alteribacter lacisalsi]